MRKQTTLALAMCAVVIGATQVLEGAGPTVNIQNVAVGNAGNTAHGTGWGAVNYDYRIGTYEVTAGQYTEFLNAVATTDTHGLYDTSMDVSNNVLGCGIVRTGPSGSYAYSVAADRANRPVNFVSWADAARFANWMENGQPIGLQDATTTEDGTYTLVGVSGTSTWMAVTRNTGSTYALPTIDEWYKAAHHKNDGVTGNYYLFPTSSDSAPGYIKNDGTYSIGGTFVEGGTDPGNIVTHNADGGAGGIGSPYYRTLVGEHENSASPYGTFDQAGNLWELTEGIFSGNASQRSSMGGSYAYQSDPSNGGGSLAGFEGSLSPTVGAHDHGFRLVVPEPMSLTLLATGGLALLRRRVYGN